MPTFVICARCDVLGAEGGSKLVVVKGMYSMLGDTAPLPDFVEVKRRHGAYLLVEALRTRIHAQRHLGNRLFRTGPLLQLREALVVRVGAKLFVKRLAVFLGVQQGFVPYVLAADGERGLDQRLSLEAAARKRGMRVVLPSSKLLADSGIRFDGLVSVAPERWRALAKSRAVSNT